MVECRIGGVRRCDEVFELKDTRGRDGAGTSATWVLELRSVPDFDITKLLRAHDSKEDDTNPKDDGIP